MVALHATFHASAPPKGGEGGVCADPDMAREFLGGLDQVHLVAIKPDAPQGCHPVGRDFGSSRERAVAWAAERNAAGENVYWTVNTVRAGLHKKPGKAHIAAARFAHVDIDPPKDGGEWDEAAALDGLLWHSCPPSFVIHSGGGLQAFWRLEEPVENLDMAEAVNLGLRHAFGGDNCQNIDRLMRLPGFINWPDSKKLARGRAPALARIVETDDGVVYGLQHLAAAFPAPPPKKGRKAADQGGGRLDGNDQAKPSTLPTSRFMTADDLGLGPRHPVRKAIENPPGKDRSADLASAARRLANLGCDDVTIKAVLMNPANAVSEHAYATGDPDRAVTRVIELVREDDEQDAGPVETRKWGGICLADFHAYMPAHTYIFAPNGEMWPAASINARIPPIPLKDKRGNVIVDEKGNPRTQTANQWLDQRRAVEQMTWAPGKPQVVSNCLISGGDWLRRPGCNVFNLYRPPNVAAGDPAQAEKWVEHIRRIYPDDADHLIRWLAHRVQRPHEKINHCIVLGGSPGIGKDTILEPVQAAVGPWNFANVLPHHILGRFNAFVKSVILRINEARDAGEVDRYAFYDHTKTLMAAPPATLPVDEKHIRAYEVFNVCGVIITTNHKSDGIYLPADDRRHYVAWSEVEREEFSAAYWDDLYGWFATGGTQHVASYLRTLSLDSFDAKAPPPKTRAFWDIVGSNQTPEDAELADALDSLGHPSVVTVARVADVADHAFREWILDRRNSRKIPHRFEECGYSAVRNPDAVDGMFKIDGKRCIVYGKKGLSPRDHFAAINAMVRR